MKKHVYVFLIIWLSGINMILNAQDPTFSQFYAHRVYLNPAFTGTQAGLSIGTHYRNQWNFIPGGFTSYSVWADIQEPSLSSGFGIMAIRDEEGAAGLISQGIGLSYAYILRVSNNFNINIGIRSAYWQKHIDWNQLVFSDQLHPLDGIVNGTAALAPTEKSQFVDFDAGIVARWQFTHRKKTINSNLGFAISHLAEPEESLQYIGTEIPRRLTVHLGTMIPFSFVKNFGKRVIYLSPNLKMDYQSKIQNYAYGLYLISNPLYIGAFYQNSSITFNNKNTNFITFIAGIEFVTSKHTTINIAYSFDTSTTGLDTRSRGVHELTTKINFDRASIFGSSNVNKYGKKKARKIRRGRRAKCFQFKGRNSIQLF